MVAIRAIPRDPDDRIIDGDDYRAVLDLYAEYLGGDVGAPVWASDIPEWIWTKAEEAHAAGDDD